MRAAKVQASLRIRAVSPEPSLLAHTSSESRGTFRQKARSLAPLNGCACAVKICHDGMLEDTNSLDGAHLIFIYYIKTIEEADAICAGLFAIISSQMTFDQTHVCPDVVTLTMNDLNLCHLVHVYDNAFR